VRVVSRVGGFAFIVVSSASSTFGIEKPETSHLTFVSEYVRELAAIENIRASAEQELQEGVDTNKRLRNGIYASTRIQLELRVQVTTLKHMHLNPPFDLLITGLTVFYEQKIELYQKMIDIATAFLAEPEPGVNYGKLAAMMPEIRAMLDSIDQGVFEATPTIFHSLIDMNRTDSKGHCNRLVITNAERAELIENLTDNFGQKLDQKDKTYYVSSASALKMLLLMDFKCSDDPLEDRDTVKPITGNSGPKATTH
jgi:hypothetical protein